MGLGLGLTDKERDYGFEKVTKANSLIQVLKERLPESCNIFNMAQNHHKFQKEMTFYILQVERDTPNNDPWILATYKREDYGIDINISGPRDMSRSAEFKAALINSRVIAWEEPFIFAATDSQICPLVQDAVLKATGKSPFSCKNLMFYTTPQCHPAMKVTQFMVEGSTIELKPLDATGSKFLVDNWPFAKSGSLAYVRKLVERNGSSGVFIDGKLVAGAALNGSGMITMLFTMKEHRHKGYAQLCMNYLVQALLKDNLIPCCTVEMTNTASLSLQKKIGLKVSHEVSYISRSQS